jgi:hypothetical protein
MAVRLGALFPRAAVVILVWILASGTLTFAAEKQLYAHVTAKSPVAAPPPVLVVPDVRAQAFVFAKGILEDGGFAWHVAGSVQGYSTNRVVSQEPAPGTRIADTGAPTITLQLSRGSYAETGTPENDSPYAGTATRLATAINAPTQTPSAGKLPLAPPKVKPARAHTTTRPARPARHTTSRSHKRPAVHQARLSSRPPAFIVPGARKEPLDEIPLPARAERLSAWLTPSRSPTALNQRYWLYQHAWIVTGAEFGWWHGAIALRTLISVDRRVESQWGIGYRSEAVARQALAAVGARAK